MSRIDAAALALTAGLLATPFYFASSSGGIVFAPQLAFDKHYTETGFGITIGLFGIALLAILIVTRLAQARIQLKSRPIHIVIALIVWFTAIASYGFLTSPDPVLSMAFYVQTIIPLGVFMAALSLPVEDTDIRAVLLTFPTVGAISILLIVASLGYQLSFRDPIEAWAYTQEAFFGVKSIQPAVALVGFAVILAEFGASDRRVSGGLLWMLFAVHAIYILTLWSRTGIAIFGIVFGLWWLREVRRSYRGQSKWYLAIITGSVMATMAIGNIVIGGTSMRPTVASSLDLTQAAPLKMTQHLPPPGITISSLKPVLAGAMDTPKAGLGNYTNRSDERRLQLLFDGIDRLLESPLVGDAFQPVPPGEVIEGRAVKAQKLYPSHNQYVDIGIRAGLPAVVLFLTLLMSIGVSLWRRRGNDFFGQMARVSLFVLVALLVANFFQIYFIVTQSAAAIYMLFGLSLRHEVRPGWKV